MNTKKTSIILMILGFSLAALCWIVIMAIRPSEGVQTLAWIGQALGIGIGSIGVGARVTANTLHK